MSTPTAPSSQYTITAKAGWIAIGVGGAVAAMGLLFLLIAGAFDHWATPAARETPGVAFPLAQIGSIALLQLVIGTVAVIAGVGMLRRRMWSRSVLEGLCWTSALEVALIAVGANRYAPVTTPGNFTAVGTQPPGVSFAAFGAIGLLTYVAAFVLAIRALRSPAMYDALEER